MKDIRDALIEEAFYAMTIARSYMPDATATATLRDDWEVAVVDTALALLARHIARLPKCVEPSTV